LFSARNYSVCFTITVVAGLHGRGLTRVDRRGQERREEATAGLIVGS